MGDMRPVPSSFAHATASHAPLAPADTAAAAPASLKIVHVLRSPFGGLFRHVVDLARGQIERGHRVGIIADDSTGGAAADTVLGELAPDLALGLTRFTIARHLEPSDIGTVRIVSQRIAAAAPDVVHGHGAKGAALARLTSSAAKALRVYTPHGGSLAYSPGTLSGGFYRTLEWLLNWRTDLFLFESSFAAELYRNAIGRPRAMVRVVRNGVAEAEFEHVTAAADATDIVCIGELRDVKGFDVLIDALAILNRSGRRVSATIAGTGPDEAQLRAYAQSRGVGEQVRFIGHCPARRAFAMGRIFVMCSRAESLPYVVLEAAAAGLPIVSTAVGGVPEIFGALTHHLLPPENAAALAGAIGAALLDPSQVERVAQSVRDRVRSDFSVQGMVDGGLAAYREAIALRKLAQFT